MSWLLLSRLRQGPSSLTHYVQCTHHLRQLLDSQSYETAVKHGGHACTPSRELSSSPSLGKTADGKNKSQDSSKSKKAKWRKWADQQLDPKKAASKVPVTAAAVPDARQLPISEIAEPSSLKSVDAPVDVESVQPSQLKAGLAEEASDAFSGSDVDRSAADAKSTAAHAADGTELREEAAPVSPLPPSKPSLLERLAQRGKEMVAKSGWATGTTSAQAAAQAARAAGSTQGPTAAHWDTFVADQNAAETMQPAASADAAVDEAVTTSGGRVFRNERLPSGPSTTAVTDPRHGYMNLGRVAVDVANEATTNPAVDGAGRPVAMAPSRLHPTRDFFPGQFYRPADLNPFAEPETDRFQSTNKRAQKVLPTTAEVQLHSSFRNTAFLSNFLTNTGRIIPRKQSGLQAKLHRKVSRHIKLAKAMALAPIDTPASSTPRKIAPAAKYLVLEGAKEGIPGQNHKQLHH